MRSSFVVLALCGVLGCASTQPGGHLLPLTRLRLYESGVGYFERSGALDATPTALPVPESHVDDVLASLVLLSESAHGAPGALRFPSRISAAVARARAGLPADTEEALGYDRVLASLRGEAVEVVVDGRSVRGRVLEAVAVGASEPTYLRPEGARKTQGEPHQIQLVLLSDEQQLERIDASLLTSVRPLDPSVAQGYAAALSARRSLREGSRRALLELFSGMRGAVRFGYVSEVPLWRPTYRLLLDAHGARLQAWAVVHNDTDEAWRGVRVSLEAGFPKSFLFPLTAPRYGRRALRHPDNELPSVPQLLTTNADAMWGDFGDYAGEELAGGEIAEGQEEGMVGLGLRGSGRGGGGSGGRVVAVPRITYGSKLIEVGDLARPAAPGATPGARIATLPITLDLPGHHSALVPFLMGAVDARPLTWFDAIGASPRRAVRVVNGADRTLPDGPLSVYRGSAFTGEGVLHRARPGQAQYVRVGGAQDGSVQLLSEASESKPLRLAFSTHPKSGDARVVVHGLRTSTRELEVAAGRGFGDGVAERIAVGLPIVANATLRGADAVDYDGIGARVVALFELPPDTRKRYRLDATEAVEAYTPLEAITDDDARAWLAATEIPAQERAVVEHALPTLSRVRALRAEAVTAADACRQIEDSTERVRMLLDKTTGEAATPLVTRLVELEHELTARQAHAAGLARELAGERSALREQLRKLPAQPI